SADSGTADSSSSSGSTSAETGDGDGDGDTGGQADWDFDPIYGVPNLDDDDLNGKTDWLDPPNADDDDLSVLTIGGAQVEGFAGGDQVRLVLETGAQQVRLWNAASAAPVAGDTGGSVVDSYTFSPTGNDEFQIEFENF